MLKQLMLSKKIEKTRSVLDSLLENEKGFETRSKNLERAIEEASTEEEISTVEESIKELEDEKQALNDEKVKLEEEISKLDDELNALNENSPGEGQRSKASTQQTRAKIEGDEVGMKHRYKFFSGMTRDRAEALVSREDVKEFLTRTRQIMTEKRAVTGAELTIPDVMLELLRDSLNKYSRLVKRVNVKKVSGKARQTIAGATPEGIWTEACAKLNELNIVFNQIEVDGYKVGGFIAECNATLEDSDLNLANEILDAISQAIGLAIDKAILYGTGNKMPVGIITRLAETVEPAYYGDKESDWKDLHLTNLLVSDPAAKTDTEFYKDLIMKLGKVKANYSDGKKFWVMNQNTFATLQAKALTINAAGTIVSGQNGTMPIIGGDVEFLDFVPNNVIIGGYGSLYLLAERKGATLAQSEHVQFIEDNTVFKGTARYDGRPVFGEGFVAINISQEDLQVAPTKTAVTFAPDTANA